MVTHTCPGLEKSPGRLVGREVPEMKMQSLRDWRLFVFPAGMMGEHGQAPTHDLLHPDWGEMSDRSLRLLQPAESNNPSLLSALKQFLRLDWDR